MDRVSTRVGSSEHLVRQDVSALPRQPSGDHLRPCVLCPGESEIPRNQGASTSEPRSGREGDAEGTGRVQEGGLSLREAAEAARALGTEAGAGSVDRSWSSGSHSADPESSGVKEGDQGSGSSSESGEADSDGSAEEDVRRCWNKPSTPCDHGCRAWEGTECIFVSTLKEVRGICRRSKQHRGSGPVPPSAVT